jgi:hypothetical protein
MNHGPLNSTAMKEICHVVKEEVRLLRRRGRRAVW